MLSLHKLEIFHTVASEGSFSAAAERLYLTQSAVSQHIQGLEAGLGTKLFTRGRRGVALTPAGESLLAYARQIVRLLAEAESAVTNVDALSSGQIRIGATPGAGMYLVPDWARAFQARYPNLSVTLTTDVTQRIAAAIARRTLDLGVVEGEIEGEDRVQHMALQEDTQLLVVGPGHTWYAAEAVPISALRGQPFIARPHGSQTRAWLDESLVRHGITPNIVAEFDNPEAIKQAVMSGMGVTILPEYAIRREQRSGLLRGIPVAQADLRRVLRLVWDSDLPLSAVTRAFLRHLLTTYPQIETLCASVVHAHGPLALPR